MPPLRSQRRDRRARAPKKRRRRNLAKFVPSSDSDFAMTARNFTQYVQAHRDELNVCERDAQYVGRLVREFREALAVASHRETRTEAAVGRKNERRKEAERWVRMIGRKIRTDHTVDLLHKHMLRLVGLTPRRTSKEACPQRPPVLHFIGTGHGVKGDVGVGNGSGVHVLRFFDMQSNMTRPDCGVMRIAKPDGASGIELWVGFLPQDAPGSGAEAHGEHGARKTPRTPQEYVRWGYGWPLFLRKYTTNPIETCFPMPDRPMLIVYWARWVSANGDSGRFCNTCIARVEGWPQPNRQLPASMVEAKMHADSSAQHALPAGAVTPGAITHAPGVVSPNMAMMDMQRLAATFMLVGTPLELPEGEEVSG
jgi:hypothetical protein